MKKHLLTIAMLSCFAGATAQPCLPNPNSLSFDGTTSYLSTTSQSGIDITDSITVEAWIYPMQWGTTSAQNSIVCKHGWSQGEKGYVLRAGGTGQLSFNFAGLDAVGTPVSWVDNISAANALTLNAWNHVAGTFDGTNSVIYINGVAQGTVPFTGTIVSSAAYNLAIGRLCDPGQAASRYFKGYIDEVRIWHRALSASEIQSQMNDHVSPSAAGLASYWRMNDGTGSNAIDLAAGNNAVCNNTTWSTIVPFNNVPIVPAIIFNGTVLVSNAPSNNQWYVNGTLIPGATQTTYAPQVNGIYTVVVTNAAGCSATSNGYNISSVGVNEIEEEGAVFIYPNPATDWLYVHAAKSQKCVLTVTDVLGKVVKRALFNDGRMQLDIGDLFAGCYLLEAAYGNEKHYIRFIKQ